MRKYIKIILTWNKHIKPLHKEMGENIAQTMPLTETMTETKHPDFGYVTNCPLTTSLSLFL